MAIFHVSDHRDEDEVANTWSDLITQGKPSGRDVDRSSILTIISKTVQKAASSPEQNVDILANKVANLSKRFYPSEVALPLRKCGSISRDLRQAMQYRQSADILLSTSISHRHNAAGGICYGRPPSE